MEMVMNYVITEGEWDWEKFSRFIPMSALLAIAVTPVPVIGRGPDVIYWKFTSSSNFSVKSTYFYLVDSSCPDNAI